MEGIRVVGVHLLSEVIDFLQNAPDIHVDTERVEFIGNLREDLPDFRDICGQAAVKRAVEVAVAGRHNILMVGPRLRQDDDCKKDTGNYATLVF